MTTPRFTVPIALRLTDTGAEEVRRNTNQCLRELQESWPRVIANITLADGAATHIAHTLGRAPLWIKESIVRGATSTGRIVETIDGVDRSKFVLLTATGWGATITISLLVL